MGEFELIRRYFSNLTTSTVGVSLGIGDDAAILDVASGEQLVVTVDTSNADVHFPADADAFSIGFRALAVNLSDLAAMGAVPRWFTLSLTLPAVDETWLAEFARGLAHISNTYNVALVGGDTTRGALAVSIQAMGVVPKDAALRRQGAQPGDLLYVSGTTGDAAAGLACYRRQTDDLLSESDRQFLLARYLQPTPRVALGCALRHIASSCIDISDGLLADAGHIAQHSGVAITINSDCLPVSDALSALPQLQRMSYQLGGGDDYELCFTVPPAAASQIHALAAELGIGITCIGEIAAGSGVICKNAAGETVLPVTAGFEHF